MYYRVYLYHGNKEVYHTIVYGQSVEEAIKNLPENCKTLKFEAIRIIPIDKYSTS